MNINYAYYRTAAGYKIVGGTAAQFLKADGSTDGNSYVPERFINNYYALTNVKNYPTDYSIWGTVTGAVVIILPAALQYQNNIQITIVNDQSYNLTQSLEINAYEYLPYSRSILVNDTGTADAITRLRIGKLADNRSCIILNDITTVWGYPQIVVQKYTGGSLTIAKGVWSTQVMTDLSSITGIQEVSIIKAINSASLASSLTNYYTKNEALNQFVNKTGVETISGTKTFSNSPIIPNGTLGTHAVNLNQLNGKVNTGNSIYGLEWDGSQTYLRRNNNLEGYLFHSGNLHPENFVTNGYGKYFISFDGFENYLGRDGNLVGYLWHSGNLNPGNFAAANHTHTFGALTSKPTTISGYGITDAIQVNVPFTDSVADQSVIISDNHVPGVTGIVDTFDDTFYVGREINGDNNTDIIKIASKINETNGINIDAKTGNVGIGSAPGEDKVMAKGLVVADGFKTAANLWSALLATNGGQVIAGDNISIQNGVIDFVVYNKVVTQPYTITSSIPKFFYLTYAGSTSGDSISIPDSVVAGTKIEVSNTSAVTIKVVKGSTSINVVSNQCVELYFNGVGWIKKYNTIQYF
jgi:hypothetical protein